MWIEFIPEKDRERQGKEREEMKSCRKLLNDLSDVARNANT
jgi:hypothetical protein